MQLLTVRIYSMDYWLCAVKPGGKRYSGHHADYGDGGGRAGPAPKVEEGREKPRLAPHPSDILGEPP